MRDVGGRDRTSLTKTNSPSISDVVAENVGELDTDAVPVYELVNDDVTE